MCGIFCFISKDCPEKQLETFKNFEKNIFHRGPNSQKIEYLATEHYNLLFTASVLWLQGTIITPQPIVDSNSIFLYNGDVFGGQNTELRLTTGDTHLIYELIKLSNDETITNNLSQIQGPYAFIYVNKTKNRLYFGRDIYGRRSLLLGKCGQKIIITSVAKRGSDYTFIELPSIGIFCMDLLHGANLKLFPCKRKNKNFKAKLEELEEFLGFVIDHNTANYEKDITKFTEPNSEKTRLFSNLKPENNVFETLLNDTNWLKNVKTLEALLRAAIKTRISTQPAFCQSCYASKTCPHSLTSILFSGGIDCAILALLAAQEVPNNRPIDLINVAFDRSPGYATPDRKTGVQTLAELQALQPNQKWNFLGVNVSTVELNAEREAHIADLIHPLKSVLDDSLGCALWFAARGETEGYKSPARVVLVGMGADELFGGYTRHRAALKNGGWSALEAVLEEDWQNLSFRNLARDDRVVSDHGRQLRTPYLDENVVEFVRGLSAWEKTFPGGNLAQGIGEKVLLRSLGYYLGLRGAACLRKRALQFGSRIANPKENAHEVSGRL